MFLIEFPEAKSGWCMRGFVNDSSWSWCRGDRKQWIARCMCCLRMLVSGNPSICTFLWPSHILYSNIRLVMLWEPMWPHSLFTEAASVLMMMLLVRSCKALNPHIWPSCLSKEIVPKEKTLPNWWMPSLQTDRTIGFVVKKCIFGCNHMVFHGSNRDGQVFGRIEW